MYPFGFGLSYAKFSYGHLKLSDRTLNAGASLDVQADVKNASDREGDEVVELYLSFPNLLGAPHRALRGLQRIHLKPGTTQQVHLTLSSRDLSFVNEAGDRLVAPGIYGISVGGGQPAKGAPDAETNFEIRGTQNLPD